MFDKINIGTAPNTGDGDSLRDAFNKVNENYDDTYTKEEVNTLVDGVEVDLSNYDTSSEVDAKIDTAIEGIDVDLTNYYDKGEVDGLIDAVSNSVDDVYDELTLTDAIYNGNEETELGITFKGDISDLVIDANNLNVIKVPQSGDYDAFGVSNSGLVSTTNAFQVNTNLQQSVTFGHNNSESGVIDVRNITGHTRVLFDTPQSFTTSTITFPNKTGTVAMLDDISGGGIEDAPSDGKTYARKDASWTELEQSEPGVVFTKVGSLSNRGWYKLDKNDTRNFSCTNSDRGSIMLGMWTKNYAPSDVFNFFQTGSYNIIGGTDCIAIGDNCLVGGTNSFNMGSTENNSIIWGQLCRTTRSNSSAFGLGLEQRGLSSGSSNPTTLVGSYNNLYIGGDNTEISGQRFVVGIGTAEEDRKDGFFVHKSGEVVAPNLFNNVITDCESPQVLTTREFVEEFVKQPANLIDVLSNATPAELDEIKGLLGIV